MLEACTPLEMLCGTVEHLPCHLLNTMASHHKGTQSPLRRYPASAADGSNGLQGNPVLRGTGRKA